MKASNLKIGSTKKLTSEYVISQYSKYINVEPKTDLKNLQNFETLFDQLSNFYTNKLTASYSS